jgi:hypothetical protein
MKTMKPLRDAIVCASLTASAAFASPADDLAQIAALSAELSTNGIAGMLAFASRSGLKAPWMPFKWHVENKEKDPDRIKVANEGREFGVLLANKLDHVAEDFQRLPPNDELLALSGKLCELSEWIDGSDGIGNLLLAGRCLDLASVGLGRLVANLDFPLAKCETLGDGIRSCMDAIDFERRAAVLDAEIGDRVFSGCRNQREMRQVWEAGKRRNVREELLKSKSEGMDLPENLFREDSIAPTSRLDSNKSFFAAVPFPRPSTTLNLLKEGSNNMMGLVGGGVRTFEKALGLLDFRREIGCFPEPWVMSKEEREQLEKEIVEAAKWGIKINPIDEAPSFDPLDEAFQRAWHEKIPDVKRSNDYVDAFHAYKEISENRFFDEDTALIRLEQESRRLRQEREEKRAAELQKGVEGSQAVP